VQRRPSTHIWTCRHGAIAKNVGRRRLGDLEGSTQAPQSLKCPPHSPFKINTFARPQSAQVGAADGLRRAPYCECVPCVVPKKRQWA